MSPLLQARRVRGRCRQVHNRWCARVDAGLGLVDLDAAGGAVGECAAKLVDLLGGDRQLEPDLRAVFLGHRGELQAVEDPDRRNNVFISCGFSEP